MCLHEFRYRSQLEEMPAFKPISKRKSANMKLGKMLEAELGSSTPSPSQPKVFVNPDLDFDVKVKVKVKSTVKVVFKGKVELCTILAIIHRVSAAHLNYEEYPNAFDEVQPIENLKKGKGERTKPCVTEEYEATVIKSLQCFNLTSPNYSTFAH